MCMQMLHFSWHLNFRWTRFFPARVCVTSMSGMQNKLFYICVHIWKTQQRQIPISLTVANRRGEKWNWRAEQRVEWGIMKGSAGGWWDWCAWTGDLLVNCVVASRVIGVRLSERAWNSNPGVQPEFTHKMCRIHVLCWLDRTSTFCPANTYSPVTKRAQEIMFLLKLFSLLICIATITNSQTLCFISWEIDIMGGKNQKICAIIGIVFHFVFQYISSFPK